MKYIVKAIGIFLILVGINFAFALIFAGGYFFHLGLVMLLSVVLFCVGGFYSGVQLLKHRRRGRVAASLLLVWALFCYTYMAIFHKSEVDATSVVVILAVIAGLIAALQLPGVRKICDT